MSKDLFWNRATVTSSLMDDLAFKMRRAKTSSSPRERIFETVFTLKDFDYDETFGLPNTTEVLGTVFCSGQWSCQKIENILKTNPDPLAFDSWQLLVSALAYNYLNLRSLEPELALVIDREDEKHQIKLEIWVSVELIRKID